MTRPVQRGHSASNTPSQQIPQSEKNPTSATAICAQLGISHCTTGPNNILSVRITHNQLDQLATRLNELAKKRLEAQGIIIS